MAVGDMLYANTDSRPLCVAVRGSTGWWNFTTNKYESPATPVDLTKFSVPMLKDPLVPTVLSVNIPAAACADPAALLIESLAGGAALTPTNVYWISTTGFTMVSARGSTFRVQG